MSDINDPEMGDGEDLEDALAWLEQLAAGQGAPLDELPSVSNSTDEASTPDWLKSEPSSDVVAESADQIDLDWLDNIASGNAGHIEEPPTMSWDSSDEAEMDDLPEDPEEAMAWLDHLSADQGASLDELSSILGPAPTLASDEEDENALDWLEQLAADKGLSVDDLPGMNVASNVTPTLGGKRIDTGESVDMAEILAARSAEMPEDPDEAMDWLESLASEYGLSLNDLAEMLGEEPEEDVGYEEESFEESLIEPIVDLDPPSSEIDFGSDLGLEDDEEAAMAWLEKLAAGQGASLDELPSVDNNLFDNLGESAETLTNEGLESSDSQIGAVADSDNDIDYDDDDAAMAWLEQLAAHQGASLDELPSVDSDSFVRREQEPAVAEEAVDPLIEMELAAVDLSADSDEAIGGDVDYDDDDAAMAWLEQLAAGQGASLDELPSVETVSQASTMPSEPAAAMSWLEKLAKQSTFVTDLPSMAELNGDVVEFDLETMPTNPADAIAWLEGLASGNRVVASSTPEAEVTAEPVDPLEAIGLVDMMADDDDMDDAMAWLEQLAAKQGANMDELPSVDMMRDVALPDSLAKQAEADQEEEDSQTALAADSVDDAFSDFGGNDAELDKVSMPDWFSDQMDDGGGLDDDLFASLGLEESSLEPEEEGMFDFGGSESSEPLSGNELTDSLLADDLPELSLEIGDESISDAMPAWFSMDATGNDMSSSELGWLDTVVESDFTSWMAAEAEASKADLKEVSIEPIRRSSSGRGGSRYAQPEQSIQSMGEDPLNLDLSSIGERKPISEQMKLDTDQLQEARRAIDSGNFVDAITAYETLVQAGADIDTLVIDLKLGIAKDRNQPAMRYLLGDAYRKMNNLDEALKCYRSALIKIG